MIRARRLAVALALVCLASPAWAVKEWYDHYREAQAHLDAGSWEAALESLDAALRLKPQSGLNERTYGMNFVHYFPYLHQGIARLEMGEFSEAIRLLNIEEQQGAIKREPARHQQLKELRTRAEDSERQRLARLLREEVRKLLSEADEQEGEGNFDEALQRLASAQEAARSLDPGIQAQITQRQARIRAAMAAKAEAEARRRRIAEAVGEGERLLTEGNHTEAAVRFDEVLDLDPGNARARRGKAEAERLIQATLSQRALERRYLEGRDLFEAGRYDEAIPPLTEAVTGPRADEARPLLEEARQVVERMRQQRQLRRDIESLLAEGEAALEAGDYAQAHVRFESVLGLDPGNMRAQDRLAFAERRIGERILDRWLPPRPPVLNVLEPRQLQILVEAPTIAFVGSATDDRSIDRIELRAGEQVLAKFTPSGRIDPEAARNVRFDRVLTLEEGLNEIRVIAWDGSGLQATETFQITRALRFYETRAFLPAALAGALSLFLLGLVAQRTRRARAVRGRFNPYIAGAPVLDESMFFGREKLTARMLNVLHHNSLMITGERRIGKTTFLLHLSKVLAKDDITDYRFFPVFTDLQGVPESAFFHTVMADVVESIELKQETLDSLRFEAESDDYDGRDFAHDLQRVVGELRQRTDKHVKLALLIDEVDALNDYSDRINQRLRSIFMKTFSEHLVAVMSGVGIRRIWKSEGSPWYNFFDEIELQAFTREEAEALIRTPVAGVFRFSDAAIARILELSELKPYLIQKFCIHAINVMLEAGRTQVSEEHVEAVRAEVLLDREHAASDAPGMPA